MTESHPQPPESLGASSIAFDPTDAADTVDAARSTLNDLAAAHESARDAELVGLDLKPISSARLWRDALVRWAIGLAGVGLVLIMPVLAINWLTRTSVGTVGRIILLLMAIGPSLAIALLYWLWIQFSLGVKCPACHAPLREQVMPAAQPVSGRRRCQIASRR